MSEQELREEIESLKAEIKRLRKSLTRLAPSLSVLLRRRGFRIYKKEPPDDLLIPGKEFIDDYYRLLQRYSFRLLLRDVIKHQEMFALGDVTRYAVAEVTEGYIDKLLAYGLVEKIKTRGKRREAGESFYRLTSRPVKSFGPTLEWFLSEIFKREFAAESIWGIKFKRPVVGGDYDLIAKIDGSILYMEVKSSPPKQIYANEIAAFLDRVFDLLPGVAIFFMDTELRMKDKIVPMFEDELRKRGGAHEFSPVKRIEKELFQIEDKIYIINSKDSIVNNIEKVLSRYFRRS